MKITLVGCGALGSLFAAGFLNEGEDLQVLQRPGTRFNQLSHQGLRFRDSSGTTHTFRPPLASSPEELTPAPVVIVTTKAYATSSIAPLVPELLEKDGWMLTLQNGLGNAEIFAEHYRADRIALGPCTYGAWLDEEGIVHAGGEGELLLGPFQRGENLLFLQNLFEKAGFHARLREDPRPPLWEKLMLNASINPVSALARRSNEHLLISEDLQHLMKNLVKETAEVARSEGVPLDYDKCWEKCLEVCKKTKANKCSMLQDVEAGRRTEIDAISGQVVLRARKAGIPVPFTESLWRLLRGADSLLEKETSSSEKPPRSAF
ncbi:MAG TPA: 2-dehydropantoate 2-reductase [Synergistaceae bacterium]|nr:2-dehydropantoate 2-reductase [Synergistaceae bacterium]HPQ36430.1 2-dehydropantoate 2-reductase [Synergistaceae bacterium]